MLYTFFIILFWNMINLTQLTNVERYAGQHSIASQQMPKTSEETLRITLNTLTVYDLYHAVG